MRTAVSLVLCIVSLAAGWQAHGLYCRLACHSGPVPLGAMIPVLPDPSPPPASSSVLVPRHPFPPEPTPADPATRPDPDLPRLPGECSS